MSKYEVELTLTATAWIEVEAEDEDEAHDLAKDEAYALSSGEWDRDDIHVDGIKKLAA